MALELVLKIAGPVASLVAVDGSCSRSLGRGSTTRMRFVRGRVASALAAVALYSPIGALAPRPADLEDATLAALGADYAWERRRTP